MRKLHGIELENQRYGKKENLILYALDSEEENINKLLKRDSDGYMRIPYRDQESYCSPNIIRYKDIEHKIYIIYVESEYVKDYIRVLESTDLGGYQVRLISDSYKSFLERVEMIRSGYDDILMYLFHAYMVKKLMKGLKEGEKVNFGSSIIFKEDNKYFFETKTNQRLYEWRLDRRIKHNIIASKIYQEVQNNHNYIVDHDWAFQTMLNNNLEPKHRYSLFNSIRTYMVKTKEGEIRCSSNYILIEGTEVVIKRDEDTYEGVIDKVEEINELDMNLNENLQIKGEILDERFALDQDSLVEHLKKNIFSKYELNHAHLAINGFDINMAKEKLEEINPGDILVNEDRIISFYPLNGRTKNIRVYVIGTDYEIRQSNSIDYNNVRIYEPNTKFFVVDKYMNGKTQILYILQLCKKSWIFYQKNIIETLKSMKNEVGRPYEIIDRSLRQKSNLKQKEYYIGYEDDEDDDYVYEEDDEYLYNLDNISLNEQFNHSIFVNEGEVNKIKSPLVIKK